VENSTLMFSHYADAHQGCCIGFAVQGDFLEFARPVKYSDRIPTISAFAMDAGEFIDAVLFTKANQWKYEREWRMIRFPDGPGIYKLKPATMTSITFGTRCTTEHIERIKGIISNRSHPVRLSQALVATDSYYLTISPLP
jgi:Protein of unknown function (DUF2971)